MRIQEFPLNTRAYLSPKVKISGAFSQDALSAALTRQCSSGDMMKKTKYHARALGIVIAIPIIALMLYGAISSGQIYPHSEGMPVSTSHINYSNSSSHRMHELNSSAIGNGHNGSKVQFLNRTSANATGALAAGNRSGMGNDNYNSSTKAGFNTGRATIPKSTLFNKTLFLQNATVASQSTYMKGSKYLILKTVNIAYSNLTFNISQVSYVKLTAEANQKNSGVIIFGESSLANASENASQQVLVMTGTNATVSGVYSPGRLQLSVGNTNTTDRIAIQIELNITPVNR